MLDRILAILAVLSFALTIWRWIVSLRFPLHRKSSPQTSLPAITLVKPLKGCNADTRHCLRSWFTQRYSSPVQIIFGVASADDPVCAIVRELLAEFSQADAQLIVCEENLGANGKVSTLRQLEPHIRHPIILLSDADVWAPADFAAQVAPLFDDSGIGLVNCFYRLANPVTLAMRWEAIAINGDFWTQVLQSRSIQKVDFALGAVMSMPASVLKKIGGFAPLAEFLADDYHLGRNIARTGGRIEFSSLVVECWEAPMGWKEVWSHQLRWARTIRVCQPLPFFMSVLGNATLWPLLWLIFGTNPMSAPVWLLSVAFRIFSAVQQQIRLTQSGRHLPYWWLVPIKDLLDALIWAAAFWGNHVEWRGQRYRILAGGKLLKVSNNP